MQTARPSRSPTELQWPACAALHMVMPLVVEVDAWFRRQRQHLPAPEPVEVAVAPALAAVTA
ncbi:MAG TPA: hypothetical protein VLJ85_09125 [Geodermatophilus sp.]|jgi:hypothetical protein|nr:hypothetical protein [Geodermatophilus sp.]